MFRLWLDSMTNGRQEVDVSMAADGNARVAWGPERAASVSWDWVRDHAADDNWQERRDGDD